MSIFTTESLHSIAEASGISLKEEVAGALLQDVEYRMREIIHEAKKFMLHSRRKKLLTDDINNALRVRNVEPLYGFSTGAPVKYRSFPISGNAKMFFLEDREIDLDDIINSPLPPVPVDIVKTSHWLAIEGVQPAISQNPNPQDLQSKLAITSTKRVGIPTSNMEQRKPGELQPSAEPTVKGSLSKELQMFYEKVTEALLSTNQDARKLAIESLQKDAGIQPLMPYLMQFITEKVATKLKSLPVLWTMCRTVKALFQNPNIFIEPYLHNVIPVVITCIVSKRLSQSPTEDHWSLREFAAQLIAHIFAKFGSAYHTLQNRISKTLLKAYLDPLQGYGSNYGAIMGLSVLGDEVIRLLMEPNVKIFGENLKADLDDIESNNDNKKFEAKKCFDAIVNVISQHIVNTWSSLVCEGQITDDENLILELNAKYEIFADKLYEAIKIKCTQ
ncbi:Transcription initiation factor TFIID subunit 6 [Nowakowskiella sp. JEL0078]|nr:Transcription initiation factor TFIID subunit 6 [Nowakowskiella sp. JEL0078]